MRTPLVRSMSVGEHGEVFLLLAHGDTVGAILRPGAERIAYVLDLDSMPAKAARSAVLRGEQVLTAGGDGLRLYELGLQSAN